LANCATERKALFPKVIHQKDKLSCKSKLDDVLEGEHGEIENINSGMCTVRYEVSGLLHAKTLPRNFQQCIAPQLMNRNNDLETDSDSRNNSLHQGNHNQDPRQILASQLRQIDRQDFMKLLSDMNKNLKKADVRNIVFLCKDIVPTGVSESFEYGRQVFGELIDDGYLSHDNMLILAELLNQTRRMDLLKLVVLDLNAWRAAVKKVGTTMDRYRVCLFELSENLTKQDIQQLIFLLTDLQLPKSTVSKINDGIGLFTLMEEQSLLEREDYSRLRTMLEQADLWDSVEIMDKYLGNGRKQSANTEYVRKPVVPKPAPTSRVQTQHREQIVKLPPASIPQILGDVSFPDEGGLPYYKMNARPRGWCVIINNKTFERDANTNTPLTTREGSDIDCRSLEELFEDLRFNVSVYENLTARQMIQVMQQYSVREDHTAMDCFVCCILTHGKAGHLYGVDGQLIPMNDITNNFKGIMCPSLAGKPKLFFLQACQGRDRQQGVASSKPVAPTPIAAQMNYSDLETDDTGVYNNMPDVPSEADFLLFYATVRGYVSYRSRSQGSWFVNSMVKNIRQFQNKYDLMTIMSNINAEVAQQSAPVDGGLYKQVPMFHATLRKRVFFSTL
jgi:hypothetical protein